MTENPSHSEVRAICEDFFSPPEDARPMMRWWWFGPAVTCEEIQRELEVMKNAGIGGVEVQSVYPLSLDEAPGGVQNLKFLSAEFLDMVRFASSQARALGLRFELTLGSGWPFGGSHVPVEYSAPQLRWIRTPVDSGSGRVPCPSLSVGESLIGAFASDDYRELAVCAKRGIVSLEDSPFPMEVWFFVQSRTGQQVKRAAVGAEGFVLDHYRREALEHYLKAVGQPLVAACGAEPPDAVFCDSLEVYRSDWSVDFLAEFRARRQYDLKPHLPALLAGSHPAANALRCDWGRTLTELLEERFLVPLQDWARRKGTRFRAQLYGCPPAVVSSAGFCDVNEGEGFEWRGASACRLASSAAHLLGRTVVSSETWTWLHSPAFRASPLDLKAEADLHFLQGITRLVGHGWPYSPENVSRPGWRFYAAAALNDQNPWWIVMPEITSYLQRVGALVRRGRPVADVLFYLSNSDGWGAMEGGNFNMRKTQERLVGTALPGSLLSSGFSFDFCDDRFLATACLEGDMLRIGENRYRAVVLPGVEAMPVESARLLHQFVRAGGVVISSRRLPERAPGFLAGTAEHEEVRRLMAPSTEKTFPGHVLLVDSDESVGPVLGGLIVPDLNSPTPGGLGALGFIHRETPGADIYFLANTGNVPYERAIAFRTPARSVYQGNPLTGQFHHVPILSDKGKNPAVVPVDLAPYESTVLVFADDELTIFPLPSRTQASPRSLDISRNWTVRFEMEESRRFWETLRSWTEDSETRYFSGVATYSQTLQIPEGWIEENASLWLDFGVGKPVSCPEGQNGFSAQIEAPVREAAIIHINSQRVGAVWCSPYQLDVTGFLRPGSNSLSIEVANLALNHLASLDLPDYRLLHQRYGQRFDPQDMDRITPIPAGLLGPVSIVQKPNAPGHPFRGRAGLP